MKYPEIHTEQLLLHEVANGSEAAFRSLFERYSGKLYHFILPLTGSAELAEDIVQDSFLKIWLYRERLSSITHFNAYLFRMARNAIITGMQRRAVETGIITAKLAPAGSPVLPDEELQIKFVKNTINEAVNSLPEQQRKVWLLRRESGMSINEIAGLLHISAVTVKRHLTEAGKKLRQVLKTEFPDEYGILLTILALVC